MDKVDLYRRYVEEILRQHHNLRAVNATAEVEDQIILDRENDHYQLLSVGWEGERRVYHCTLHVDIKSGRIWLQRDYTDGGIARELIEKGVPKEDIVLAFHAPYKRPWTGFAA